ncbi:hypothetical protein [Burkholderia cenocepacia]|uniref:hypothetical protein n=1 Tax=Burkholderia cenocepacia TaxID=95486 RepID=UPI001BA0AD16|nr:hypothetical protein [Burkholderia cenocepacia]MBR7942330.1 hypothetical protein [Burkholderia cenocepacia]
MSEIQKKLMHEAADECMSPDQRDLFDVLGANDPDVYARLFRAVSKRSRTDRDYFAAKAMQVILSKVVEVDGSLTTLQVDLTTDGAYLIADAMLRARGEA